MWCQTSGSPLRLGKRKAKALEIHMHFCGFSQHSFIHYFIFFATWDVICCSQQVLALVSNNTTSINNHYLSEPRTMASDASEQQEESTFEDRIISFIHSHILTLVPLGPRQIGSLYVQWTEWFLFKIQCPVLSQLHSSDNRTCKSALQTVISACLSKRKRYYLPRLPGPCSTNIVSDTVLCSAYLLF